MFNFSFFSVTCWEIGLDYCDIEWFALEMNRDHSTVFEIASKYCISNSFVDHDGYSISSKGFLPIVVDIMVIWVKFIRSDQISRSVMSYSLRSRGLYSPWNSLGQNIGVGAFPFSRRSSQPRDWSQVSYITSGFFTSWDTRELNVVKQEIARLNIDILGISELKWMGMGEFIRWPLYLQLWARMP